MQIKIKTKLFIHFDGDKMDSKSEFTTHIISCEYFIESQQTICK